MIYKVFYQERKDRSPRRENTKVIYLEVDADNELDGRIKVRQMLEDYNTKQRNAGGDEYNVELVELLSEAHLNYEKESGAFELTEL